MRARKAARPSSDHRSEDGSGEVGMGSVVFLAFSFWNFRCPFWLFLFPLLEPWCISKDRVVMACSWSCVRWSSSFSFAPQSCKMLKKKNHPLQADLRSARVVRFSREEGRRMWPAWLWDTQIMLVHHGPWCDHRGP